MSDPAQSGATVAGGGRATRKPQRRESFAGRGAFLIAAIGSAVGLGKSGGSLMSPIAMVVEPSSCLIW